MCLSFSIRGDVVIVFRGVRFVKTPRCVHFISVCRPTCPARSIEEQHRRIFRSEGAGTNFDDFFFVCVCVFILGAKKLRNHL